MTNSYPLTNHIHFTKAGDLHLAKVHVIVVVDFIGQTQKNTRM